MFSAAQASPKSIIDLTYNVTEGPKVMSTASISSATQRTLDEVIRREFKLSEGDAYSSSKLKRTEQRLNNLGYFEKVNDRPQTRHRAGQDRRQCRSCRKIDR